MSVPDYLRVDISHMDHEQLLSQWRWLVPDELHPLMMTFLGDLFLTAPDGSIHFLNTLKGSIGIVAHNTAELDEMLSDREQRLNWFPSPFYLRLKSALGSLGENECYSCDVPMSLGGVMDVQNFQKSDALTHLYVLGQIQDQVKDIPHGTQVDIILERPGQEEKKKGGGLGGLFRFGK